METYITTPAGRESTRPFGTELIFHAYECLLTMFHREHMTKNKALFRLELQLESHAKGLSPGTIEICEYVIKYFDELMQYLVSKDLIKIINKWTKETHFRFSKSSRAIVEILLLVHKVTNFTVKDVLINHIIPDVIGILHIPTFYISNLSFETTEEMLRQALKVPLSYCCISVRRNGKSKGFGFFTCLRHDDYVDFLPKNNGILIDGRKVVIEQSKY